MSGNSQANMSSPSWTVTTVIPKVDVSGGNPVQGHSISFVTSLGNRSDVFIPNTTTNLDVVKRTIAERAAFIDGIASLTG